MATSSNLQWVKTNAPTGSSRTDDIYFLNENLGWAVNSNGQILKTADGFETYEVQKLLKGNYLRCVGFASERVGWVGTLDRQLANERLFLTKNGGVTWNNVTNLPEGAPSRICGLSVVDENVMFASGTNYPNEPPAVVRTLDSGETWRAFDLRAQADILVDIYFKDSNEGWVVGGQDVVKHPNRQPIRDDVIPVVLHTTNGGETWINDVASIAKQFPRGEWGWKIHTHDNRLMFVSLENFRDGAFLKSENGGKTWRRIPINDRQRNGNLEGIGFVDKDCGWVGGWGDVDLKGGYTSATLDGGLTWDNANNVGFRLNRFRFIGDPVKAGYASGDTVYKLTSQPRRGAKLAAVKEEDKKVFLEGIESVEIPITVREGVKELRIDIWERFGRHLRTLIQESAPRPGLRLVRWDFTDSEGNTVAVGPYIVRITMDDDAVSFITYRNDESSKIRGLDHP